MPQKCLFLGIILFMRVHNREKCRVIAIIVGMKYLEIMSDKIGRKSLNILIDQLMYTFIFRKKLFRKLLEGRRRK